MSDTLQFPRPEGEPISAIINVETRERYDLLNGQTISVGRAEDNTLSLKNDVYASGRHAEIYLRGQDCMVKDLDSRNGTYKNNEPVVGEVVVLRGDIVTFGRTKFEFI
jgi:pSer/pThr/pTyr-binding forkhead associated (FHA) protein